jgi:WD40 repeat protein
MASRHRIVGWLLVLPYLACPPCGLAQPPAQQPAPRLDADGLPLPPGALVRLGSTRFRHREPISFLGFAAATGRVLAASRDGDARLWDVARGKQVWRLSNPGKRDGTFVYADLRVLLSRDGTTAAWREDGPVVVVDTATNKEVRRFPTDQLRKDAHFQDQGRLLSISADGRLLLAAEEDLYEEGSRFGVWNTATGQLVWRVQLDKGWYAERAELSPDGKTWMLLELNVATLNTNRFSLWDLGTGKRLRTIVSPMYNVVQFQLLPDGKSLVLRHRGGEVSLHDATSGKQRLQFSDARVNQLLLSADGKRLFGVGEDQVYLWDTSTGAEVRQFVHNNGERGPAALSPDEKTLAVGVGTTFRLWDVATGKELKDEGRHRDLVGALAFSPAGDLVVTAEPNAAVFFWEAASGKLVRQAPFLPPEEAEPPAGARFNFTTELKKLNLLRVAFSPDGKTVAALQPRWPLRRWDAATGKPLPWPAEVGRLNSFAYAPDGKALALSGADGVIRLVHPATGKLFRRLTGEGGPRASGEDPLWTGLVAFSPDGRTVYDALLDFGPGLELSGRVRGMETQTGRERDRFQVRVNWLESDFGTRPGAFAAVTVGLAVAPDGRHLAASGYDVIKLWDVAKGREVRAFAGHDVQTTTTVFSPDGKWLLAGRPNGAIRLWDVATGTRLHDLAAHQNPVTALAFSADGRRLASGSADTTALLWDWAEVRRQVEAARQVRAPGLEASWQALAADDGFQARAAQRALAATPGETVAFLKERLQPVQPADPKRLAKLLADLDAGQFAARQAATRELEKLGDLAVAAVGERLAGSTSLEARRRLEVLRDRLNGTPPPLLLREVRAVEVLEHLGTPAARQLLEALATGAPGHRVTEEAAASVRRLKKGNP